jgi:DNA-binding transcriptional LysR family regulator
MSLSWQQLEWFSAIADLQHMSRAAAQLGVSQPALSRALSRLEAELGVPLFDRIGRSIRLTHYGRLFQGRVARALREIDDGRTELADLVDQDRGTVALGFLRTLGINYIPQLLRRFRALHPRVRFSFIQSNSIALEGRLRDGDTDLIFNSMPLDDPRFEWAAVADQDLVLLVPPTHRLARRRDVSLHDCADESFVSFKADHALRRTTDALCSKAGITPTISFESDDSSSVPGLVAAGFGVAIVSPECGASPGVVALRIAEPAARRTIGIAWVTDRYLPASARLFRDFALSEGASCLLTSAADANRARSNADFVIESRSGRRPRRHL